MFSNPLNWVDLNLGNEGHVSYIKSNELYKKLHSNGDSERLGTNGKRDMSARREPIDDGQEWLINKLTAIENTSGARNLDVRIQGTRGIDPENAEENKDDVKLARKTDSQEVRKSFKDIFVDNVDHDYFQELEREKKYLDENFVYKGQYGNIKKDTVNFKKIHSQFLKLTNIRLVGQDLNSATDKFKYFIIHIIVSEYKYQNKELVGEDVKKIFAFADYSKKIKSLWYAFDKFYDNILMLENNLKTRIGSAARIEKDLKNVKLSYYYRETK